MLPFKDFQVFYCFCCRTMMELCTVTTPVHRGEKQKAQEDIPLAHSSSCKTKTTMALIGSIPTIPETGHSGQARVQARVCRLPAQIAVKGNSHMNVIRAPAQAQALIIWETGECGVTAMVGLAVVS